MSYSYSDIEEGFACIADGDFSRVKSVQKMRGMLFAHLEGRCSCLQRSCPSCGGLERSGMTVHNIHCPFLIAVP
jgi:hypothetical protein